MKRKFNIKAKFALLLAMALMLMLIVPAAAADASPAEWELSADDTTLTDSRGNVFNVYFLPAGYSTDFKPEYYFANYVEAKSTRWGTSNVVSYAQDGKIIHLPDLVNADGDKTECVYVTDEAKEYINVLISGNSEFLRLTNGYKYADMSRDLLDRMSALTTEKVSYSVPLLRNESMCEILAYDKTDSICGAYGAIYRISGVYYFVDYRTLGNNYFDSEGNFSYRAGTIDLIPLDNDLMTEIIKLQRNLSTISYGYEYEDSESSNPITGNDESDLEVIFFWIIFIGFGFVLPIAPLAIGLIIYLKRRSTKPTHWLIVACIGGAWLIVSAIIAIIIACV